MTQHKKKMTEEQERLDKKKGNNVSSRIEVDEEPGWFRKNIWTILLSLVGAVILIWGLIVSKWENPSMASAGSWIWGHWFWIAALAGIIAVIFVINKMSAMYFKTLGWVVVAIFILPSTIGWLGWFEPKQSRPVFVPTITSPQVYQQKVILSPNGKSEVIPVSAGIRVTAYGDGFRLINVYSDGHECPAGENCTSGIIGVYFKNETEKEVTVSFRLL